MLSTRRPEGWRCAPDPSSSCRTEPIVLEAIRRLLPGGAARRSGWRSRDYPTPSSGVDGDDAAAKSISSTRSVATRSSSSKPAATSAPTRCCRPYYTALVFNMRHPVLRAPRGAGRHQRSDRSRGARSQCACAGTAWSPKGRSGPITGHIRRAVSRSRYNPEAAKLRLDGAGFDGAAPRSRESDAGTLRVHVSRRSPATTGSSASRSLVQRQLYADRHRHGHRAGRRRRAAAATRLEATSTRSSSRMSAAGCSELGRIASGTRQGRPADRFRDRLFGRRRRVRSPAGRARSDEEVREALSDVMHVDARRSAGRLPGVAARSARRGRSRSTSPTRTERDVFGSLWRLQDARSRRSGRSDEAHHVPLRDADRDSGGAAADRLRRRLDGPPAAGHRDVRPRGQPARSPNRSPAR